MPRRKRGSHKRGAKGRKCNVNDRHPTHTLAPPKAHFKKLWLSRIMQDQIKIEPRISHEYVEPYTEANEQDYCSSGENTSTSSVPNNSNVALVAPLRPVPTQQSRPISELVQVFSPHTQCEVGTIGWRRAIAAAACTYHELIRTRDVQMDTELNGSEDAVDLSHFNRLRMLYTIKWTKLRNKLLQNYK